MVLVLNTLIVSRPQKIILGTVLPLNLKFSSIYTMLINRTPENNPNYNLAIGISFYRPFMQRRISKLGTGFGSV